MWRRAGRVVAAGALIALGACAQMYMKGTPLYTGEYSKPQGPPEDRVNLWPIAYYHKPALSVLWPFMEWTDDHAAIRPVFSVYKLDKPKHDWSVLYPLAEFDCDQDVHRVIPFFWGTDEKNHPYFVLFPMVWLHDKTKAVLPVVVWDGEGTVFPFAWWWKDGFTLFPFFWYQRGNYCHLLPLWFHDKLGPDGHDTHVLWPIFESLKTKEKQGWRLWPFAGDYQGKDRRYSFALWPLAHYIRAGDSTTRLAIPLYFEWSDKASTSQLVPPFYYHTKGPEGTDTHVLWPIFESLDTKTEQGWRLWPFAGDYKSKDRRYSFALWPLGHYEREGDKTTRVAFPLYFEASEKDKGWRLLIPAFFHKAEGADSLTLTPLWFGGKKGKVEWDGVVPLYYRSSDAATDTERLITPLLATWRSPDEKSWLVVPLASRLAWGKGEKDLWFLGPLAHARWGGESTDHHVIPLYRYARDSKGWRLATLLVACGKNEAGEHLTVIPLLSGYTRDKAGLSKIFLVPLFSEWQWKGRDNDLLLLWFLAHFRWGRTGELGTQEVPPAFIGFRWEKENVQNHIIPLYYYDRNEQMFLSPLASWRNKPGEKFLNLLGLGAHYTENKRGEKELFLPFLLSDYAWGGEDKELWALFPFFHALWGKDQLAHHVLPIYAYDRKDKMFLTPLVSWQTKPDQGFFNLGMLLAHYAREKDGKRELVIPPLLSTIWWNDKAGEKGIATSPLFSWSKRAKPDGTESREELWVAPWLEADRWTGTRSFTEGGKKTEYKFAERSNEFFPFWDYTYSHHIPTEGPPTTTAEFNILYWLYDYERREGMKDQKDPKKTHDYVRSRILWHVMHYDQLDGRESLDVFPFITWDRKKDGYRKTSFLWRLYRNEHGRDGSRSLDILFLPLLRKKGG
ncbi:MAG: hypothetical protein FJ291_25015 [Planctomycetes bacterium]|nr:hypothetical protein [Planctomycetota bacterium]